jgi:hypothetical protein
VAGALVLFVLQVRRGAIRWRPAAKVAGVLLAALLLTEANQINQILRTYNTSVSLTTFWISAGAGLIILPLGVALAAWLMVGLATSLYPAAWRVFQGQARRVWRRDAALAIGLSLAAAFALSRIGALIYGHFHAHAPVRYNLGQELLDSLLPGAGFMVRGLISAPFYSTVAAVVVYLVQFGRKRRAWWLWPVGALLVVSAGPPGARSLEEFLVGWSVRLLTVLVAIGIVAAFFRANPAAYIGSAFCLTVAAPLVSMLGQPAAFFAWNGALLLMLTLGFLAWLLRGEGKQSAERTPAPQP